MVVGTAVAAAALVEGEGSIQGHVWNPSSVLPRSHCTSTAHTSSPIVCAPPAWWAIAGTQLPGKEGPDADPPLYSVWRTSYKALDEFGIGVGLYYRQLLFLGIVRLSKFREGFDVLRTITTNSMRYIP